MSFWYSECDIIAARVFSWCRKVWCCVTVLSVFTMKLSMIIYLLIQRWGDLWHVPVVTVRPEPSDPGRIKKKSRPIM